MPYAKKEDRAKQMRRYRERQKRLKEKAKKLPKPKKKTLASDFPDIYEYIFGHKPSKKR